MMANPENCQICKRQLDQPTDPTSRDCGGDCALCMASAGDPDCRITVLEATAPELLSFLRDLRQSLEAKASWTGDYPIPEELKERLEANITALERWV